MFRNTIEYWKALQLLRLYVEHPQYRRVPLPDCLTQHGLTRSDLPTPRVCRLLDRAFRRWRDKPRWLTDRDTGHLFDGLDGPARALLASRPRPVRKGMAVARMFDVVTAPGAAARTDGFGIDPDELIVGRMPPFSVGQGKELVGYLTEEEELQFGLNYLNNRSPFGHIVPDHGAVLAGGVSGLLAACRAGHQRKDDPTLADGGVPRAVFYESVEFALNGVLKFAAAYAAEARRLAEELRGESDPRAPDVRAVADRLDHVPANRPRTFLEAVQTVYLIHCALHTSGEIVPLGRLDQLLGEFYRADIEADRLTPGGAQEIIDCLWVKLGERAIHNRLHAEDRFTFADGTLLGTKGPSNYDRGGLLNQWMQQVTIGGVVADDSAEMTDASNEVTRLCLRAARRLPVNSPTLDLRVHRGSPSDLFDEAAGCLLAGGAHPVLLNDDRLVPALVANTGSAVARASAKNYACDGCYETLFAGETDFGFGFVPAPDVIEKALNRGANFGGAGPINLRGTNNSWRTPLAEEIPTFGAFWGVMLEHVRFTLHRIVRAVLAQYGEKADVCPSPLLSALIHPCLERGYDLTNGGSRYHMFSPLVTGLSTGADALYVIQHLIYETAQIGMAELVSCLRTDWGRAAPAIGVPVAPDRVIAIRELCRAQPKFGQGNRVVDGLAARLAEDFHRAVIEVRNHPLHQPAWDALRVRYGKSFDIIFASGVGTFEQYVLGGAFAGASADGRHAGDPIASDLSPSPAYADQSPVTESGRHIREVPIGDALRTFAEPVWDRFPDGAPADLNIPEDFPRSELVKVIRRFAQGKGGNVLTLTVANPATLAAAAEPSANPEDFNLVRVRMGGWTEFFIALFPDHQNQHRRRPLHRAD